MKFLLSCVLLLALLLVAGCSENESADTSNSVDFSSVSSVVVEGQTNSEMTDLSDAASTASDVSGEKEVSVPESEEPAESSTESSEESLPLEQEEVIKTVYDLSREEFHAFLDDIGGDSFRWEKAETYQMDDTSLKSISLPLFLRWESFAQTFTCTKSGFASYLSSQGVQAELIDFTIFISIEEVPMAWLQTDDGNFFIVGTFQKGLTFLFWDEKTFHDYYVEKECKVFVDGREVLSDVPAVMHGSFAEVPLIAVLRAVGAEINWVKEKIASVYYNDAMYTLYMQTVTFMDESEDYDLLAHSFACGGYSTYYPKDGEIMISDVSMGIMLQDMGSEFNVYFDSEDATVMFVSRTEE